MCSGLWGSTFAETQHWDNPPSIPQVLLGMLLTLKGGPTPGVYKLSPGSVQEKHIVIPLAPTMSRLPSLPITTQQLQTQTRHAQVGHTYEHFGIQFNQVAFNAYFEGESAGYLWFKALAVFSNEVIDNR